MDVWMNGCGESANMISDRKLWREMTMKADLSYKKGEENDSDFSQEYEHRFLKPEKLHFHFISMLNFVKTGIFSLSRMKSLIEMEFT